MTASLRYATFQISVGWMAVLASEKGLLRVVLPQGSLEEARDSLDYPLAGVEWCPGEFADLIGRFKRFFRGERIAFDDTIDLTSATPFQCEVWQTARLIPYGETRSYGWIAGHIGKPKGSRAVGQALGKNPIPIIVPCHRVLASDGNLGGFTGGLEMKKYLLKLEASGAK